MNNPLGVNPTEGKQGVTRGKKKIYRSLVTLFQKEMQINYYCIVLLLCYKEKIF